MDPTALMLARLQFAFTISFHIIFPAFTIGLSAYIAVLLVLWRRTGEDRFQRLARFWTKIFAVSFAMGVVSGIVLSYQFGTNWSRFSEVVGNVVGPLIGYEVLTAFYLEATFLGVLLFGWNRVKPWMMVTASILVAIGTATSAFWILAANSWMHTPAGFTMRDGIAFPTDWWAVIFNPSFPYRFAHMVNAAYLTTALVVLSVGARYLLTGRHMGAAKTMMRMAVGMIAVTAPLQLFIGDQHGLNTLEHQPAKIAAMEAHWDGSEPGKLVLFAIPDAKAETNHFEIAIPRLASLLLTHNLDGRFPGLKEFAPEDRPPILNVFFGFRVMVGLGLIMIAIGLVGAFLWWRGRLFQTRWYLRAASLAWPLGFIAILSGWIVTESGRQPWIVSGVLRTADAVSPVDAASVATTLVLFVLVYGIVFAMGVFYINRLINKGPQGPATEGETAGVASRPLSAAGDAARVATGKQPSGATTANAAGG